MQRPLRTRHHRQAHRETRQGIQVPWLEPTVLQKSPLHGQPQKRQIDHGSLRALARQSRQAQSSTDRAPDPAAAAKTCNRPASFLLAF
jgi:hypothetical protein